MLSIRLSRVGKKNQPTYRLIVVEKTKDPWGDYLEILGVYNPKVAAEITGLKEERLKYWISKGAQLSATVNNLLVSKGILSVPKMKVVRIKKSKRAAEAKAEIKIEVKTETPAAAPVQEKPVETDLVKAEEAAEEDAPAENPAESVETKPVEATPAENPAEEAAEIKPAEEKPVETASA